MLPSLKIKTCCLVVIFLLPGVSLAKTTLYKYAINLESSQTKTPVSLKLKNFNVSDKYKVYQTEVSLGRNKSFYRLRIGFFKSKKEAARVARKFKSKYSKLWIDRLHKQDRKMLVSWLSANKVVQPLPLKRVKTKITSTKRVSSTKPVSSPKTSAGKEKKAKELMARANKAMRDKKYRLAAGIYTRVIGLKNTSQHQQAMEFLGLAREKNGQLIHARAEYRLYLKKYPKGEDSLRVRQRLLSLKTLLLKPRKRLSKSKTKRSDWQFFGSILQYYRLDSFNTDTTSTSNETISTNLNLLLRKRTESLNIKSQINVNHLEYINNPSRTARDSFNIFFLDVADINNNKSIRIGRQSQNKGGVLGKMDGAWIGYRLNPTWKLNLVSGYPVNTSTSNSAQTNRPFTGLSVDIGTIAKHWNFSLYTIKQEVDSITDRNAVGGEVRYVDDTQSHFALIDYDTYLAELNTLFYVANWRFKNKNSVVLTLSQRNSPILTTTNALVGQGNTSIETLLLTYTEEQLKQFAKDRTAKYRSAVLSATIPMSKKWSFSADGVVSSLSSTTTSAGVEAFEGTGNEFFYIAQLIGYNVFDANETSRYILMYDDTRTFTRTRLRIGTRFRLKNKKWRFRPQITLEQRDKKSGGRTDKIKGELKFDYKIKRKFKLEFDLGYETGKTNFPVSSTENNYSVSAGFVWEF